MWALGNACGRSAFVDRPRAPVYLNWYIILVADSGITRKSTAVRTATSVVNDMIARTGAEMELVRTKITPEKLEWRLHRLTEDYGHAHIAVSISELVTLLGREKYNQTMPGLLTDLYDCDDHRAGGGTISGGSRDARNLFVSVLSASTPTWLQRAVNPDVVEGGFTSRTLFVVSGEPKRRIPWPEDVTDEQARDGVAAHLQRLALDAKRYGRIALTDGAMRSFGDWYKRRKLSYETYRGSFESREDAHVLRAAACLAANAGRWVIEARDIKVATRLIAEVKEMGAELFEGALHHTKYIAGIDKLRSLLISAGLDGLSQRRITVALQYYMKAQDVVTVLQIMHELGMVQRFEIRTGGKGRPRTLWRATKKISDAGVIDQVLQEVEPV
jgi:hypothetical protein